MGIALAICAAEYGAVVELVLGPVDIVFHNNSVKVINVISAGAMADECVARFSNCDIAILAAAVADFTPEIVADSKIKRGKDDFIIRLKPTRDIAAELGKTKTEKQLVVGFALETDNELENAISKMKRKNLDMIVLNSLKEEGAGFGFDTNKITIIDKNNIIDKFELKSKEETARDIIDKVVSMMS